MPARRSIQDIKLWASDKDGKCLSKEYWGINTKLTWVCSKRHTWDTMPISIYQGCWYPICIGKRKGTIEEMHELAEERGGKCLSKKDINNLFETRMAMYKRPMFPAKVASYLHHLETAPGVTSNCLASQLFALSFSARTTRIG